MPEPQPVRPKVFISSVYREPSVPGSEKHLAIRRTIYDLAVGKGIDAWIAEYSAKGLENRHWTEIVDTCIDNLLAAQVFVAVLYSRAGGPVRLDSEFGFSSASIFEIELFYASDRCCFRLAAARHPRKLGRQVGMSDVRMAGIDGCKHGIQDFR